MKDKTILLFIYSITIPRNKDTKYPFNLHLSIMFNKNISRKKLTQIQQTRNTG